MSNWSAAIPAIQPPQPVQPASPSQAIDPVNAFTQPMNSLSQTFESMVRGTENDDDDDN